MVFHTYPISTGYIPRYYVFGSQSQGWLGCFSHYHERIFSNTFFIVVIDHKYPEYIVSKVFLPIRLTLHQLLLTFQIPVELNQILNVLRKLTIQKKPKLNLYGNVKSDKYIPFNCWLAEGNNWEFHLKDFLYMEHFMETIHLYIYLSRDHLEDVLDSEIQSVWDL